MWLLEPSNGINRQEKRRVTKEEAEHQSAEQAPREHIGINNHWTLDQNHDIQ